MNAVERVVRMLLQLFEIMRSRDEALESKGEKWGLFCCAKDKSGNCYYCQGDLEFENHGRAITIFGQPSTIWFSIKVEPLEINVNDGRSMWPPHYWHFQVEGNSITQEWLTDEYYEGCKECERLGPEKAGHPFPGSIISEGEDAAEKLEWILLNSNIWKLGSVRELIPSPDFT